MPWHRRRGGNVTVHTLFSHASAEWTFSRLTSQRSVHYVYTNSLVQVEGEVLYEVEFVIT